MQITQVFDRYFRALDEKHFDHKHFGEIFTEDGRIIRPNGTTVAGPAQIADSHAHSFARFEATQHLPTGHDATIDGETATVRANLVAIHLWKDSPADAGFLEKSFNAGGVVTAKLRHTQGNWRITEIALRIVWRAGHFGTMAETR
ncbi:nuclear transport factor 2 family protein [Nocardia heshunensis]